MHMEHGQADQFLSKKSPTSWSLRYRFRLSNNLTFKVASNLYLISDTEPSGALRSEPASLGRGAHLQLPFPLPLEDQTIHLPLHCIWIQEVQE